MMQNNIKVISCGGTFEKIYDPISGDLAFKTSQLKNLFLKARLFTNINFECLMMIDSLDMENFHRRKIAERIKKSKEEKLLVIHGTDTMVETSYEIKKSIRKTQCVILTGAMVPASMKNSDAFFNLGFALAALKLSEPGVWITMNGEVFKHSQVKKNTDLGLFESLN
ncbi:MAG: hypothetical protein CBD16_08860 [Betaproteobacteria bacterium TMED156]|nr:MAG: hypothetical protein CBD16_08860 [Betaproteobacteria bacterium TMED156]|tara:strand:- start:204 stop:704 length:501 start_codon:yes stop_codon:yes gene_type:complete